MRKSCELAKSLKYCKKYILLLRSLPQARGKRAAGPARPNKMVTASTFMSESVLWLRDYLLANITDPISASRPSGQKFVMTSHPKRKVTYPLIVVEDEDMPYLGRDGSDSYTQYYNLVMTVTVYGRNVAERDSLFESIANTLRANQAASGGSREKGLFDFTLTTVKNEPIFAEADPRIKTFGVQYLVIIGTS